MSSEEIDLCRTRLKDLISVQFRNTFDLPSRTHIFYHPGADVKGFGDWPDLAYENFEKNLDSRLKIASHEELIELENALNNRHQWKPLSPKAAIEYFTKYDASCTHSCEFCGSIVSKTPGGYWGVKTNKNLDHIPCHDWCIGTNCQVFNCQTKE